MSDPFADIDPDNDDSVGLSPEDKKHSKSNREDWFKGEKNTTYRVHFLLFNTIAKSAAAAAHAAAALKGEKLTKEQLTEVAKKALVKRAEDLGKPLDQLLDHEKLDTNEIRFNKILFHYKDGGVGYAKSRLGMDGEAADEVWKLLGEQQKCFTTCILIYPTNREGELEKDEIAKKWKVLPWRLSTAMYKICHDTADGLRNNDLSIADQDLLITFTQKKTFVVLEKMTGAGKALFRKNPKFQSMVLEKACTLYDKLQPFRDMSTADLRIKLGLNEAGKDDVSSDDMEDLLSKA